MATTPTGLAVSYDVADEAFVLTFTTTDATYRVQRSDDGGNTWNTVYDGVVDAAAGAQTFRDYLAPLTGSASYRVAGSDDAGATWSANSAAVSAVATSEGWRLRRPGMPGMTVAPFVSDEGRVVHAYTAEKSKRWPRGAVHPVRRSSRRRDDTLTLPPFITFTKSELDILWQFLDTEMTLQVAAPDGRLWWVAVNHDWVGEQDDTVVSGNTLLVETQPVFDLMGAP